MPVAGILRGVLGLCTGQVHQARLVAVARVVEGLVRARRVGLTHAGRLVRFVRARAGIKCADRLVGNRHLRSEVPLLAAAMARFLLWGMKGVRRPILLVDWTEVAGYCVLSAALAFEGRALPLYQEAHRASALGNTHVQTRFLRRLFSVLPDGCKWPIVITDAGFHGAFFREVVRLGGDFIGRIRGTAKMKRLADGRRFSKEELYRWAAIDARHLGHFQLYSKAAPVFAYLSLVCQPKASRKRRRTRSARMTPARNASEARRRAKDPWLLASSLQGASAGQLVHLYGLRMQIEETFRDLKNLRLGWGARALRVKSCDRLTVLLALAALATLCVCLVGLAAHAAGLGPSYQAASRATARALSYFALGNACLKRDEPPPLDLEPLLASLRQALNALLSL